MAGRLASMLLDRGQYTAMHDHQFNEINTVDRPLDGSIGPDVLTRWYIDTRPLSAASSSSPNHELPLLETLQPSDQNAVKAYYHLCDRQMSLASCLLKYLFVHRSCRVPWNEIIISKTPAPHKRPYYDSDALCNGNAGTAQRSGSNHNVNNPIRIEFNVSHQGYITALAGCQIPRGVVVQHSLLRDSPPSVLERRDTQIPQIGIDITCTNDPTRRRAGAKSDDNGQPKNEKDLCYFIDMFSEVFSEREITDMKRRGSPLSSLGGDAARLTSIEYRLRLFYTYWALKEAYIKMTGEALLASWLRDLEFVNVDVPNPPMPPSLSPGSDDSESLSDVSTRQEAFGNPQTTVKARLAGEDIDNVRLETVGFESDYIFATCTRGGGFGAESCTKLPAKRWDEFRLVDIEKDVAQCAHGTCACLL